MAELRKKIQIEVDAKTRKAQRAFKDLKGTTDGAKDSASKLSAKERELQSRIQGVSAQTRLLNLQLSNKRAKLREVEASSRGLIQRMVSMKTSIIGWGLAIGGAVVAVDRLVQRSFALQNVQANLPFSIDKAKEAASGLTDNFQLARLAVQANRLEVARTPEEFARVVEAAKRLGASVGRDVPDSIERLVQGLGKGEQELLDELGIVTKAEEAHRLYAERLGKTAAQLTDAEKKQAVMTIRLEEAERKAEDVTFAVDESTQAWLEAKAAMKDIGDSVIPALTQGFSFLVLGIKATSDATADLLTNLSNLEGFDQRTTTQRGITAHTNINDPNAPGTQAVIKGHLAKRRRERQQQAADALAQSLQNVEMSRVNSLMAQAQHANELALRQARKTHDDKLLGRGSKKKGDKRSLLERSLMDFRALKTTDQSREGIMSELGITDPNDPFSDANLDIQKKANERAVELERVKQEQLLQTRLNALEMQKEAGVHPIEVINREEEARKAFLESEIERAEQAGQIVEAERLRGQVEQVEHEARLRRIQEEKRAREEQMRTLIQVGQTTGQVMSNMGSATADFAASFGASSKRQEQIFKGTQASMMVVRGITEAVEAIAAFARYDYGAGLLHTSASVAAFAAAAKIGASGGGGGGGGGGGRTVTHWITGEHFGGGGGTQGASRGGNANFNEIPLSTDTEGAANSAQNGGGGANKGGGNTYVFNKGSIMTLGKVDESTAVTLRKSLDKADRTVGTVRN